VGIDQALHPPVPGRCRVAAIGEFRPELKKADGGREARDDEGGRPPDEENEDRWKVAKVKPNCEAKFTAVAKRLMGSDAKQRYQAVSANTGVP